jgi:hypothetical protein
VSAERHAYVLDERQLRVLARAQAEADAIQREADRLGHAAGELLNDATGVILQAHGVDLSKVGQVDLEDGKLLVSPKDSPPLGAPAFVAKAAPEEKSPGPAFVAKPSGDS